MKITLHRILFDKIVFKTFWEAGPGGILGDELKGVEAKTINAFVAAVVYDLSLKLRG